MALYALQTAYGISAARNVATISQVFGDVNAGETTNIPPDLRQTQKADVRNLREHYRLSVTDGGRARR